MSKMTFTQRLAKYRLQLALITIIIILLLNFFVLDEKPYSPLASGLGLLGSIIAIVGLFLRSWAAGIINKNKKLTTIGPYHLFRHPLYIGSLLIAVGFIILLDSIYLWIILIFFMFFVYMPKIKAEEKKLKVLFGEQWDQFVKVTSVFFPKRFSIKKLFCKWSLKHWVHHTEYNAYIAVVIALIAIHFWSVSPY